MLRLLWLLWTKQIQAQCPDGTNARLDSRISEMKLAVQNALVGMALAQQFNQRMTVSTERLAFARARHADRRAGALGTLGRSAVRAPPLQLTRLLAAALRELSAVAAALVDVRLCDGLKLHLLPTEAPYLPATSTPAKG